MINKIKLNWEPYSVPKQFASSICLYLIWLWFWYWCHILMFCNKDENCDLVGWSARILFSDDSYTPQLTALKKVLGILFSDDHMQPHSKAYDAIFAGQTHFLKKETERLKQISVRHRRSRSVTSCFEPGSFGADPSAINWQMLDMSKLSLNGSPVPVPPRGGYGL